MAQGNNNFGERGLAAGPVAMSHEARDAIPEIDLFTDGTCEGNPGRGGYGVVLRFGGHRKELSGSYQETTNNRMELMAAVVGLRALKRRCRVKLTSDSKYLVDSLNKGWVRRWRQNGWWCSANKQAANHDLWELLLGFMAVHEVTLVWTRGHAGDTENESCDRLARQAIESPLAAVDKGYEESKAGGMVSIPEGHPCFKCRTPLVRRIPKERKVGNAYGYDWYLYCPGCTARYMVDEGKRLTPGTTANSLFKASEVETEHR